MDLHSPLPQVDDGLKAWSRVDTLWVGYSKGSELPLTLILGNSISDKRSSRKSSFVLCSDLYTARSTATQDFVSASPFSVGVPARLLLPDPGFLANGYSSLEAKGACTSSEGRYVPAGLGRLRRVPGPRYRG